MATNTRYIDSKRLPYQWARARQGDRVHYDWMSARGRFSQSPQHTNRYAKARHIARLIKASDRSQQGALISQAQADRLRSEFTALAEQWRRETGFLSSLDEKILHSAYQSIIAMGLDAVPLVLEELESRRGHWFWALHFMTKGANPVPEGANIEEARDAWLQWGRQKGYLK